MNSKITFFIDGGYFIRRVKFYHRKYFPSATLQPEHVTRILRKIVSKHRTDLKRDETYRVFYYDAPPYEGQMREPVTRPNQQGLRTRNFKQDPATIFQKELHINLSNERKVALRMGQLSKAKEWQLNSDVLKSLLSGNKLFSDLVPEDFHLNMQQKGVDTRLGIDITTVALNQFSDTMVLVASDADFVPAAKVARTNGMDVILDPLWGNVASELDHHIDGKKSYDLVSVMKVILEQEPDHQPTWWVRS
ncbi:NYN domain-containing protein [Vibrio vulnificus]|uniref:NYN domain-containing protein n=1 Tax=Vibrio vulnificus TaxID=672 RepID=UPI001E58B879|nr:NYN domain-containing protein [Vibrio vulnificus]MCD1409620.1 NYN domain-containing protein [Vibrio vulnificus]MCD1418681.1 NYN domain-containing protein [Vibrio vulnificus]MCD1422765.1 NYN domain-containing protein [Vibrio vulnificus]MCD1437791.1 NYN domain-containing protein [Vibrio vulnificus]MCD1442689.1 NYN domain-containing protein [Vibrio vulnificus]